MSGYSLNMRDAVAALFLCASFASGQHAEAQTITITSPTNDSQQGSNSQISVTGKWSNMSSPSERRVDIEIREVDVNDQPVEGNPIREDSVEVDNSPGTDKNWVIHTTTPSVPQGNSRKYRIQAFLYNDETKVGTATSFFYITVSGPPGGGSGS